MDLARRALELEKASQVLDPIFETRHKWLDQIAQWSDEFIDSLPTAPAYRSGLAESPCGLALDGAPLEIENAIAELKRDLLTYGLNPASGGHLGYIPGGGLFPCALGDYLAAVSNQYAGMFFAGPGAVRLEHELVRWMCRLIGYPPNALGNLTSGGSIANLIAFVTARDAKGISSERVAKSVIYLTEQVHHCVHKAIRIGGMSEAVIRYVDIDDRFRMNSDSLRQHVQSDLRVGLQPFLVVSSAGTTDTGAIDPLDAIADIAAEHRLWMHVDAAYGGFFLLSELSDPEGGSVRNRFRGIERSDSVAIDPHKGLFLSYGIGAALLKDVSALRASHHYRANYMQDTFSALDELNPADLSPELTKHFRGLRMWLPLKLFGLKPIVAALEEKIILCRYFYEKVQQLGFEVGPYPELSVCIFRLAPDSGDANEINRQIVESIHRDGRVFVSSTTIDGVYWIRLAVLCFRTHLNHIEILLSQLAHLGSRKSAAGR